MWFDTSKSSKYNVVVLLAEKYSRFVKKSWTYEINFGFVEFTPTKSIERKLFKFEL